MCIRDRTETSPLGSVTTYTHDKEGNVLTQVDENGKQTAYTYDKPVSYTHLDVYKRQALV